MGMGLLIMISLFLPQILFAIQDAYRMKNTETQARSKLDVVEWNAAYEKQLSTRLTNLLNMQDRTITAIEYEFLLESEQGELLSEIFYEEWFGVLYNHVVMTNYVYTDDFDVALSFMVQDCKKYLVHGKDYQDGVALMMWYFDLYLTPVDTRIQILVDAETDTLYYVKITAEEGKDYLKENKFDKQRMEQLYYCAESIPYYFSFYYDYYEADAAVLYSDYGTYDEIPWFVERKIEDSYCEVVFPLYYGELNTEFWFRAELGKGAYPDLIIGLPIIGELIPEMLQN